jgi:pyruvate,orthophosphate dikinase
MAKMVYFFGPGKAEGKAEMKNLLGGKGANLAEMANIGIPVPAGFTITTEVCTDFMNGKGKYPAGLDKDVKAALAKVEKTMGMKFGDPKNPLLVSVRSGARSSMPGMMETVLNVGLTTKTRDGLIALTKNPRFVYDAHRRLIQMYTDVVMEKAEGVEPAEGMGIRQQLEREMAKMKQARGVKLDTELTADDLKELIEIYKVKVKEVLGKEFPDDAMEQLWGGIGAVFKSWNGKRAVAYRNIEGIPHEWGTAVNVQTMVFGNMGDDSGTGVAFTRNPATGEDIFYGEWLANAQGEDVVAGIRTPDPINEAGKTERNKDRASLEKVFPKVYKQLDGIQKSLEKHYHDMLDIEFTVQQGRLWMLQCRVGKRTGPAALKMAVDMTKQKLITPDQAVLRVTPAQLDEVLHPILDPKAEKASTPMAKGLPAGPGGACGVVVFTAADAVAWKKAGKVVILVREETNPEDVEGMRAAEGILTARGGMTSHAALVARGWGKCCIVGAGELHVDVHAKTVKVEGSDIVVKEGDYLSLNGSRGYIYAGQMPMVKAAEENPDFQKFMDICNKVRTMGVRTNADTPEDAAKARTFGAQGIGLFRTEHMFYGVGSDAPLFILRKMILSDTTEERKAALVELYPYIKKSIKATMENMAGLPMTIRLLDPPLHEFVPQGEDKLNELANALNINLAEVKKRGEALHESNPMMGHRGCRLGVTYPEITEAFVKAILESAVELIKAGKKVHPEIMVPVVAAGAELNDQVALIKKVHAEVAKALGVKKIDFMIGTMIEIPRAALTANKIAEVAEFFSFGTNDLTQMGFGFSRDDIGGFVPDYLEKGILPADPFQTLDQEGIGQLVQIGIERGRSTKPNLKVGICGEHGGDPASVEFCFKVGMNYVSCSPFRVPIAILAAAQAKVKADKAAKPAAKKAVAKKPAAKKVAVKAVAKKPAKKGKK